MSTIDKVRNKTRAKKNEECDIFKIVKLINEKCPKILNAFESVFIKYKILNAIESGASRRDHHDFKITVEEIDTKLQHLWTVEHKGTQKKPLQILLRGRGESNFITVEWKNLK